MAKSYPDIGTFTSGQILTAATMNDVGTNLDNMRVPPMARFFRNTAQTLGNASDTLVAYNSQLTNTDGIVNTSGALTVQTAGVYVVTFGVTFAGNVTGTRAATLTVNATALGTTASVSSASTAGMNAFTTVTATTAISLAANDVVRVYAFQSSGGNLDISSATNGLAQATTNISLAWLGQVS